MSTMGGLVRLLTGTFLGTAILWQTVAAKPDLVYVQVSDCGWGDVGWTSDDFRTPNLDNLRENGVKIPYFYAHPSGGSSRIAVATGRYPYKLGYPKSVRFYSPRGNYSLSLSHKLLPQYLKKKGYKTHLVGNWNMGICSKKHFPLERGFDSFYGSLGAFINHYTHQANDGTYDFWQDYKLDYTANGTYSTTLFTKRVIEIVEDRKNKKDKKPLFIFMALEALHKPLQAPQQHQNNCIHISDSDRRMRCAMMAAIDDGIGQIVKAFNDTGYSKKLVLFFTGLNGGPKGLASNHFPLRGAKGMIYEGGSRVPTFAYGKRLKNRGGTFSGVMNGVDILPTFLSLAGIRKAKHPDVLDGQTMIGKIRSSKPKGRKIMVYDIDDELGAIRKGDLKLIFTKNATICPGWWNNPNKPQETPCKEWELYNVTHDNAEEHELSETLETELKQMKDLYEELKQDASDVVPMFHAPVESPFNDDEGNFEPNVC